METKLEQLGAACAEVLEAAFLSGLSKNRSVHQC